MNIEPLVSATIARFLAALDATIPGFVHGLYVVGSAVLDDFRPGLSDLNFVAVTATAVGRGSLDALERVHRLMNREFPYYPLDGSYFSGEELRLGALALLEGPCVIAGQFQARGRHGRRTLDLHSLSRRAETVRGLAPDELDIRVDHRNLDNDVVLSVEDALHQWPGVKPEVDTDLLAPEAVSSGVLALCRLHHTLMTATVTSKTNAGLYGLITFPERWQRLIEEALRIRRHPDARPFYSDARALDGDAFAFAEMILQDARVLTGQPAPSWNVGHSSTS